MKKLISFSVIFILSVLPLVSSAALINRGNGLIYDEVKNLTWLQDTDYAHTTGYTGVRLVDSFGRVSNSVDPYGRMTWAQTKIWADELQYGGYDDWRLPTTTPERSGFYLTDSELGYMFYVNLGNSGAFLDGVYNDSHGLLNKGMFNMPDGPNYWTSTAARGTYEEQAWVFVTSIGFQGTTSTDNGSVFNAWAVRDGDVASVPEPSGIVLMLSGLLLLGLSVPSLRDRQNRERR